MIPALAKPSFSIFLFAVTAAVRCPSGAETRVAARGDVRVGHNFPRKPKARAVRKVAGNSLCPSVSRPPLLSRRPAPLPALESSKARRTKKCVVGKVADMRVRHTHVKPSWQVSKVRDRSRTIPAGNGTSVTRAGSTPTARAHGRRRVLAHGSTTSPPSTRQPCGASGKIAAMVREKPCPATEGAMAPAVEETGVSQRTVASFGVPGRGESRSHVDRPGYFSGVTTVAPLSTRGRRARGGDLVP